MAAVTVPSFEKAGFSFAIASTVADVLVAVDNRIALLALHRDGGDLLLEADLLAGGLRLVLRADRELVLLLAGELEGLGHVLGGGAHVVAVEGVPEPVLDHGIDELEIAHLLAAAQVLRVGGERHRFLAARHDDGGVAVGDLLHADRDGAKTGAADLVEAPGGRLLRDAGRNSTLDCGRVLRPLGC